MLRRYGYCLIGLVLIVVAGGLFWIGVPEVADSSSPTGGWEEFIFWENGFAIHIKKPPDGWLEIETDEVHPLDPDE